MSPQQRTAEEFLLDMLGRSRSSAAARWGDLVGRIWRGGISLHEKEFRND